MSSITAIDAEIAFGVVGNSIFEFDLDATSDCQIIDDVTILTDQTTKIYPNPVSNELRLDLETDSFSKFEIVNSFGVRVLSSQLIYNQNRIDVSMLNNGIYFITLISRNNQEIESIKFVKME